MRRALLLLLVTGVVLGLAGPAQAKGPGETGEVLDESVAIKGPGGSAGLSGSSAMDYADLSNIFNPTSRMSGRPLVALGPRYDVTYSVTCEVPGGGTETVSINQALYPYARFGSLAQVWTFTPAGQPGCGFLQAPAAGWVASRRGLLEVLTAAGLPASAPVAAPGRPLSAPHGELSPVWFILAAGGLLTLLFAAAGAGRARARASL
jgi:hypothetical protein